MPSLTIRDLSEETMDRLRALSARERRSLNKEILVVMEDGLRAHVSSLERASAPGPAPDVQLALWRRLAGQWQDKRTTPEIVEDIRRHRTAGREVRL